MTIINSLINQRYVTQPIEIPCSKRPCYNSTIDNNDTISIICYNARGLADNDYLNEITINNQVTFVCETGASAINQLEDQIATDNVTIYNKLGSKNSKDGRGATKGGTVGVFRV